MDFTVTQHVASQTMDKIVSQNVFVLRKNTAIISADVNHVRIAYVELLIFIRESKAYISYMKKRTFQNFKILIRCSAERSY